LGQGEQAPLPQPISSETVNITDSIFFSKEYWEQRLKEGIEATQQAMEQV